MSEPNVKIRIMKPRLELQINGEVLAGSSCGVSLGTSSGVCSLIDMNGSWLQCVSCRARIAVIW